MASWAERHLVNRSVLIGVRLGREIDGVRELEVEGRRSGKRRRTPVKVLDMRGGRYVVSLNGVSGWVCNLRERPQARLRFGRAVEDVVATELDDLEKAPVLSAYADEATREETRRRLRRDPGAVPVFRLTAR